MRYEALSRYEPRPEGPTTCIPAGSPLGIRIFPEDTDIHRFFVAMVQAAYEMKGTPALGGLDAIDAPSEISAGQAENYLQFSSRRSLWSIISRKPDTRVPTGIHADFIHGHAVRLHIFPDQAIPGTYEMATIAFIQDVGPIEQVFNSALKRYARMLPRGQ
jgi:hypothetical protein